MREDSARVGWPALVAFGAPAVGAGYMYLLLSLYVMKFATDVLLTRILRSHYSFRS